MLRNWHTQRVPQLQNVDEKLAQSAGHLARLPAPQPSELLALYEQAQHVSAPEASALAEDIVLVLRDYFSQRSEDALAYLTAPPSAEEISSILALLAPGATTSPSGEAKRLFRAFETRVPKRAVLNTNYRQTLARGVEAVERSNEVDDLLAAFGEVRGECIKFLGQASDDSRKRPTVEQLMLDIEALSGWLTMANALASDTTPEVVRILVEPALLALRERIESDIAPETAPGHLVAPLGRAVSALKTALELPDAGTLELHQGWALAAAKYNQMLEECRLRSAGIEPQLTSEQVNQSATAVANKALAQGAAAKDLARLWPRISIQLGNAEAFCPGQVVGTDRRQAVQAILDQLNAAFGLPELPRLPIDGFGGDAEQTLAQYMAGNLGDAHPVVRILNLANQGSIALSQTNTLNAWRAVSGLADKERQGWTVDIILTPQPATNAMDVEVTHTTFREAKDAVKTGKFGLQSRTTLTATISFPRLTETGYASTVADVRCVPKAETALL